MNMSSFLRAFAGLIGSIIFSTMCYKGMEFATQKLTYLSKRTSEDENIEYDTSEEDEDPETKIRNFWAGGIPEELQDIFIYLKDRDAFEQAGANMPKGLLLIGDPGTGKTHFGKLLAKVANAYYFYASASQFDDIYVGSGAKKIRFLFEQASHLANNGENSRIKSADDIEKDVESMEYSNNNNNNNNNKGINRKKSLSVIFLDELDALGSRENMCNDVRQPTLNQLLASMEGVKEYKNILVIAATNVPENIDSALKRTGRFDRALFLKIPNCDNRFSLLNFYLNRSASKNCNIDVELLKKISMYSSGFNCSDMKVLVNEANILCARIIANLKKAGKETNFQEIDYGKKLLMAFSKLHKRICNERWVNNQIKYQNDEDRKLKSVNEIRKFVEEYDIKNVEGDGQDTFNINYYSLD